MNKKNTLTQNRRDQLVRFGVVALMIAVFMAFSAMPGMLSVFAGGAINTAVEEVLKIVESAGKVIGAIIALWGIFQIIMAMRREDSEGISKQITTVVVGGALVVFGASVRTIYKKLAG